MDEEAVDVIVIGAGVAGAVCAYLLAQEGREVVLIERGEMPGTKNLSGGVFYCDIMKKIFPDFLQEAPIERIISRNCLSFLSPDSFVNIDYWDQKLADTGNAVSVLRSHLDSWLVEQCEAAGVMVMPGIKVDKLLFKAGKVVGVQAGEEEIYARVVVAADGVNSFISRDSGLRSPDPLHHLAVGVKSVIKLDQQVLEDRFNCKGDEGVAYAIVGDCTKGLGGGGFLYTNRDTISIGVVVRLDELEKSTYSSSELHDHFLTHPAIARLLEGGELQEYGCHLVAEGGKAMVRNLCQPGFVLIGDAAGFTLNTGFTVRGMDLAADSARCAAIAVNDALERNDFTQESMSKYPALLGQSFTGKDMDTYANAPAFLENPRMYGDYGKLASSIMYKIFRHDLTPRQHLVKVAWQAFKESPVRIRDLAIDGWKGLKAL